MSNFKGLFKESSIFSKLLMLIGFACFFTLIAISIWMVISDGNSSNIVSLKILQMVQATTMFIIPSVLCAYLFSDNTVVFLNLSNKFHFGAVLILISTFILAIPFINLVGEFNQQLHLPEALKHIEDWMKASELQAKNLTEKILNVSSFEALLLNIFLISLLPAIGEEFFFRGVVQNILKNWKGTIVAIWITAFIFSTIHFQFYGFIPRLLLGAFLGYLLMWSGNLWIPILGHFVNNFIAVVFYYLNYNGYQTINIDTIGTGNSKWIGVVSFFLLIPTILYLRKTFLGYSAENSLIKNDK